MRWIERLLVVLIAGLGTAGCFVVTDLDRFQYGRDQIILEGMGEFANERIELRVVDITDVGAITLVGRAVLDGLQPAEQDLFSFRMVNVFREGRVYQLQMYVDMGRDGVRDPTDPSFIGTVENGVARVTRENASSFDDPPMAIGALPMVLRLTDMAFHTTDVQLFELALVDVETDTAVGYFRLADVNEADFDVVVPAIVAEGREYDLEFWADANQNGLFDGPPNDHSWLRKEVATPAGIDLDFLHVGIFQDLPHL